MTTSALCDGGLAVSVTSRPGPRMRSWPAGEFSL